MHRNELKQLFRDYFTFSRTERKGFTVLGILLGISLILNEFSGRIDFPGPTEFSDIMEVMEAWEPQREVVSGGRPLAYFTFNPNTVTSEILDSLNLPRQVKSNMLRYRERGGFFQSGADFRKLYGMNDSIFALIEPFIQIPASNRNAPERNIPGHEAELFFFDPNTATPEDLTRLGLNSFQRRNLLSFRERGGAFRTSADVMKIYGMDDTLFERLEPWMDIQLTVEHPASRELPAMLDINQADSLKWLDLPGIGPVFSGRIIRYRQVLGGFNSVSQVSEVFGMTRERFEQIEPFMTVTATELQQIRINFADLAQLRAHPYITPETARKIVQHRSENGSFASVEELLHLAVMDTLSFLRVKPYMTSR